MQEPKYDTGPITNRASGEVIPQDEPVMIFRGRDIHAQKVIEFYATLIADEQHQQAVCRRIQDFASFRANHPDRMKEPDTELSGFEGRVS